MKVFFVVAIVCGLAVSAAAQPADTPENRRAAAARYIAAIPVETMVTDMIDGMTAQQPPANRSAFKTMMRKLMRVDFIERITVDGMTKHFTVQEIDAMTRFYASPEGQSITKKFGPYMADIMPAIQQEVIRAAQKAAETQ
jgi:hypothetical protein